MEAGLPERLVSHARGNRLFAEPGLALLAVSGGPDSLALLDLFAGTAAGAQLGLTVAIGHVDHGIAPRSDAVAHRVREAAIRYGVSFGVRALALGPATSETRARRRRYEALRDIQREMSARYLVTAHHADDQNETILYRVLRGTGPAGLAGIPARGRGGLVRPLLPFTRAELAAWLAARGIDAHQDPANTDERHDRSWLRRRVLPLLHARWGATRLDDALARVGEQAAAERVAWSQLLRVWPELGFALGDDYVEVDRRSLARYHKVLSQALLRALARELGHVLSARHTERLRVFAARGTSGRRLELGNECEASLHFDRLRLTRGQSRTLRDPVVYGREEQGAVRWSAWEIRWRSEPAGQSERRSTVTWIPREAGAVRQPEPGDRLLPLGGVGRRPVRRLLMEARVPRPERETYPVVLHRGEIVWLPGVCRAAVAVPPRGEPSLRLEARRIGAAGSMAGVTRSADWKNDDGP